MDVHFVVSWPDKASTWTLMTSSPVGCRVWLCLSSLDSNQLAWNMPAHSIWLACLTFPVLINTMINIFCQAHLSDTSYFKINIGWKLPLSLNHFFLYKCPSLYILFQRRFDIFCLETYFSSLFTC